MHPQISIKWVREFVFRIWFSYKDRIVDSLQSLTVYLYKCGHGNASYIGQTKRQLKLKIAERREVSVMTGLQISKPPFSAIWNCCILSSHPINNDDFSVFFSPQPTWQLASWLSLSLLTTISPPWPHTSLQLPYFASERFVRGILENYFIIYFILI